MYVWLKGEGGGQAFLCNLQTISGGTNNPICPLLMQSCGTCTFAEQITYSCSCIWFPPSVCNSIIIFVRWTSRKHVSPSSYLWSVSFVGLDYIEKLFLPGKVLQRSGHQHVQGGKGVFLRHGETQDPLCLRRPWRRWRHSASEWAGKWVCHSLHLTYRIARIFRGLHFRIFHEWNPSAKVLWIHENWNVYLSLQ